MAEMEWSWSMLESSNPSMTPWGSLHPVTEHSKENHEEEEPVCKYWPEMSLSPPIQILASTSSERPVIHKAQIGLPDILKPRYFFGWEGAHNIKIKP